MTDRIQFSAIILNVSHNIEVGLPPPTLGCNYIYITCNFSSLAINPLEESRVFCDTFPKYFTFRKNFSNDLYFCRIFFFYSNTTEFFFTPPGLRMCGPNLFTVQGEKIKTILAGKYPVLSRRKLFSKTLVF